MGCLDENARIKIASRILPERVDLQEKLVVVGDGDTAAQFQERCSRLALELLWAEQVDEQLPVQKPASNGSARPRVPGLPSEATENVASGARILN